VSAALGNADSLTVTCPHSAVGAGFILPRRTQPEGLPEISRGLRSADTPGIVPNQIRILKGCQNASTPPAAQIRLQSRFRENFPKLLFEILPAWPILTALRVRRLSVGSSFRAVCSACGESLPTSISCVLCPYGPLYVVFSLYRGPLIVLCKENHVFEEFNGAWLQIVRR
jgi:hypothetical protein